MFNPSRREANRITDKLVDRAAGLLLNDTSHDVEITSEGAGQLIRFKLFGKGREVFDVSEHD